MSINLTFTGTPDTNYTPPGTAVLYGTMAYNAAGTGIRPVNDNFSQLVDVIACETTGSAEAVIDFSLATAGAEAGLCNINSARSGFSVIITASSIVLRKEVSGSGGATLSSLSVSNSGSATYKFDYTTSTGSISIKKNGTEVLTGVYTDITSGLRPGIQSYIYNGTGASYNSLVTSTGTGVARTIDSIGSSGVVTLNSSVPINTTGLGTLTGVTIGNAPAGDISAPSGDGTFTAPVIADGSAIGLLGSGRLASATDGTNTASGTCTIALPAGWSYVTLAGTLNTSATSLLYQGVPTAAVNDQIVGETAKITMYPTLDAETSYVGVQTLYHISASDGIWRSFNLTTGNSGGGVTYNITGLQATTARGTITQLLAGVTYALTGLSTTMSRGNITGQSGGVIHALTGLSATASRGTISAVSGGVRYLITGLQALMSRGNVVGADGNVPSESKEDSLPTFIKSSVKAFKKPFKRLFRKE